MEKTTLRTELREQARFTLWNRTYPRCSPLLRVPSLVAIMLLGASPSTAEEREPKRPNVLLLMADELRADALGFSGNTVVATPNLDTLASESQHFTAAYTASPECTPARAALLTGRYAPSTGVRTNDNTLRAEEVTLPEVLSRHGYTTAMIGKLHLQRTHLGEAFFNWFSSLTSWRFRSGFFDEELLTRNGFSWRYQAFVEENLGVPYEGWRVPTETLVEVGDYDLKIGTHAMPSHLTEEAWIADRAIEFLTRRSQSNAPWFLLVSMSKPHSPYLIPPPYADLHKASDMELPSTFHPANAFEQGRPRGRNTIRDARILREVIAHYYGAVTLVDHEMGRVLTKLQKLGLKDDTLIIFVSDHGNMLGERSRIFKGLMYEASARVPLLIRLPVDEHRWALDTAAPNDLTAILPTVLQIAEIPVPARVQGRSLLDPPVFSATHNEPTDRMAFSTLDDDMVVWRNFKLIEPIARTDATSPAELYDLASDPYEQHNLHGQLPTKAIEQKLSTALATWRTRVSD